MNSTRSVVRCALRCGRPAAGFTLIELILVMALLLIVLSLAAPSLSRFFRGRVLDEEARRFVALTRYGQSRAVAEGIPMLLWIDLRQRRYGLEAEPSFTQEDERAVQFEWNADLELDLDDAAQPLEDAADRAASRQLGNVPFIRFSPDGFIGESSPERVRLRQGKDAAAAALWIARSRNGLNYEIATNLLARAQR